MVYTRENFKQHMFTLQVEGFTLKSSVQAYLWVRRQPDRTETITISYRDYTPHGFYVDGIAADISFDAVEVQMRQLFEEANTKNIYGNTSTVRNSFVALAGIDYKKLETEIHDEETFALVSAEIKKLIENGALPFFNQFCTLQSVLDAIEKMELRQMSKFIGQPLPFRRMIVKKLCNDPGYEDYARKIIDDHKAENDPEWQLAEILYHHLKKHE